MKDKCTAVQMSDQMVCSQCNQAWDVNDNCKPECNPLLTSDMTMRDHIAIAYMQSCVVGNAYFETFEGVSEEAYKMADAMIQVRTK